jgi:hypothetical protein
MILKFTDSKLHQPKQPNHTITMFIIDTLEFSRDLEKAGMQKRTAEALAEKMKEAQIKSSVELATKADIAMLKQEIKISMLTTIISLGTIIALVDKFLK